MLRRPRMTSSNSIGPVFLRIRWRPCSGSCVGLTPPAREQVAGWANALLRHAHHLNISIARMVSTGTLGSGGPFAPSRWLYQAGVFPPEIFMRNLSILISGAALFASLTGAVAQQPTQRVQVGILECR